MVKHESRASKDFHNFIILAQLMLLWLNGTSVSFSFWGSIIAIAIDYHNRPCLTKHSTPDS